jgi:hypothetical protein
MKSVLGFFTQIGDGPLEQVFYWVVKVPVALICLGYLISAGIWLATLVKALFMLG